MEARETCPRNDIIRETRQMSTHRNMKYSYLVTYTGREQFASQGDSRAVGVWGSINLEAPGNSDPQLTPAGLVCCSALSLLEFRSIKT